MRGGHILQDRPGITRPTCHGIEYAVASDPPTIDDGFLPQSGVCIVVLIALTERSNV